MKKIAFTGLPLKQPNVVSAYAVDKCKNFLLVSLVT